MPCLALRAALTTRSSRAGVRRAVSTLPQLLARWAEATPEQLALVSCHEKASLSYGELQSSVLALASGLRMIGFVPGDAVMVGPHGAGYLWGNPPLCVCP
jgi:non-ribosomal peptide synthetase component E (peptide arylation enzyme)